MNVALSGKVGMRAIVYYVTTTIIAVTLGIILVISIKPGVSTSDTSLESKSEVKRNVSTADTLMDLLRNCFPPNIVRASLQQYQTVLVYPENDVSFSINYKPVLIPLFRL